AVGTDSVDYKTLALLFGMMVVVGVLRLSGFFEGLTARALRRIRTPQGLLAATVLLSGVLSAFLINDVVCVALTPLVLHLARSRTHARLQAKSVLVTLATVVLFFCGLPLELVALGAASVLLIGRVKPAKIYRQVDWSLLVMFTGLFIVVHAFQVHVVSGWGIE